MSPSPTSALISLYVKHFLLWVSRLSTGVLQGGTGRCIIKQLACLWHISRERPRGPGVFRAGGAGENSSAHDWQLLSEAPSPSAPSTQAELKRLAYYFQSPVIFSSQIFSSQLVLKEKIFDVVKTCIGRNDEISKTSPPCFVSLATFSVVVTGIWEVKLFVAKYGVFPITVNLPICSQPTLQNIPRELVQVFLCAHLHNCLRSYIKWKAGGFFCYFRHM